MKTGRNNPCPCGSGKKFKRCCHDKVAARSDGTNEQTKFLSPPSAEINRLIELFKAGRYIDLDIHTRSLLENFPDSGVIWKILGISLLAQGKDAFQAMQMAAQLLPDDAEVQCNSGNLLRAQGQLDNAELCYRRALEIKPDFAEAHYNLGNLLRIVGQPENALAHYRNSLDINPHLFEAHSNLGNTLHDLGRLTEAEASYRHALKIKPDFAESHSNLGNTLQALGRLDEAVACYQRALQISPDFAEAHYNLGNTLQELGQLEPSARSYRRALEIRPDYSEAYYNLANVLQELRQLDEAVKCYLQALEIKSAFARTERHSELLKKLKPDETIAHVNLGNVLLDMGNLTEAEKHFAIALRLDPESELAHQGMACLLQRNGNEVASRFHRDIGFGKQPLSTVTYRGRSQPLQLLVLGSALEGNMPWRFLIDREIFRTTLMAVEYFDKSLPLPSHQLVLNAIGDADICQPGLEIANRLIEKTQTPILNHPQAVLQTGRLMNAKRLGILPGVITPRMALISKQDVDTGNVWKILDLEGLKFPLLLRPPGFHGGNYFVCVNNSAQFKAAFESLPGENQLAIEFLDSSSENKLFKKYRVMCINGSFYPIHMAISKKWKVHYFSSDMDEKAEFRKEEEMFLNEFSTFLGADAISALEKIGQKLGLDYCGIDFGMDSNRNLLVFEANATMLISQTCNESQWNYRREATNNALDAAKKMFSERIKPMSF